MERSFEDSTECDIWRMDLLILVSVGTAEYSFDRLFRMIDEVCDMGIIDGNDIIAQKGSTKYNPRNFKCFNLIGRDEFQKYINSADLIICHAGTGSVILPLKLGKKIIVVPRRAKYGEHVDDHQLELRDTFTRAGYTLSAENKDELVKAIKDSHSFVPNKFKSNNARINNLIIDFITKL